MKQPSEQFKIKGYHCLFLTVLLMLRLLIIMSQMFEGLVDDAAV